MLKQNEVLPDIEKLGRHEFDLDIEEQNRLQSEADAEVQRVRFFFSIITLLIDLNVLHAYLDRIMLLDIFPIYSVIALLKNFTNVQTVPNCITVTIYH